MSEKLEDLHDEFRPLAQRFIQRLTEEEIEYKILWTLRTKMEQAKLFTAGRTVEATTGFTRNRAGQSFHNYGMAIDVAPISHGRIDMSNKGLLERIGQLGKECGMSWGGDMMPPEPQHFQMPGVTLQELQTGRKHVGDDDVLQGMIDGEYAPSPSQVRSAAPADQPKP